MNEEWSAPEDICPYCHRLIDPRKKKVLPHIKPSNLASVLEATQAAIDRNNGNASAAARELGVSKATIFRHINRIRNMKGNEG